MKRSTLLLICLLVFVALVGGAAAWMYFSPGGALAPVTAEDAVQELLDTTDTAARGKLNLRRSVRCTPRHARLPLRYRKARQSP